MAAYESPSRDTLLENWQTPMSSLLAADTTDCGSPRDTLLENWPKHTPPSSGESHKRSRVRFSDSSRLHLYQRPPISVLQSLSYTKADNDEFRRGALLEAMRIKGLIADAPHDSCSDSIRYLLRHNMIDRDDLIGIDHFVLGAPLRVRKMRKRHAAAVLRKQQELRQGSQPIQDLSLTLGKFAQSNSLKSSKNARVRAAMAA